MSHIFRILGWIQLLGTRRFSWRTSRYNAEHSIYLALGSVIGGVSTDQLLFKNSDGELFASKDAPHVRVACSSILREPISYLDRKSYSEFTHTSGQAIEEKIGRLANVNPEAFQILVSPIFRTKREGIRFIVIDGCHRSALAIALGKKQIRASVVAPLGNRLRRR